MTYCQISNIRHTLVSNISADHSSCGLLALLQLHIYSLLNAWLQWSGQSQMQDEMRNIQALGFGVANVRDLTVG